MKISIDIELDDGTPLESWLEDLITRKDVLTIVPESETKSETVTVDPDTSEPERTGVPQTDDDGLPWDARIHSTPAKLTSKNKWARRRNVDEATRTAVEAELRAAMADAPAPGPVDVPADPLAAAAAQTGPVDVPNTITKEFIDKCVQLSSRILQEGAENGEQIQERAGYLAELCRNYGGDPGAGTPAFLESVKPDVANAYYEGLVNIAGQLGIAVV